MHQVIDGPLDANLFLAPSFLPPTGKYKLQLNEKAEWQYGEREKESLEVSYTRTSRHGCQMAIAGF